MCLPPPDIKVLLHGGSVSSCLPASLPAAPPPTARLLVAGSDRDASPCSHGESEPMWYVKRKCVLFAVFYLKTLYYSLFSLIFIFIMNANGAVAYDWLCQKKKKTLYRSSEKGILCSPLPASHKKRWVSAPRLKVTRSWTFHILRGTKTRCVPRVSLSGQMPTSGSGRCCSSVTG